MAPSSIFTDLHVIQLLGRTFSVGPSQLLFVAGWLLFAGGAFVAAHERAHGRSIFRAPPIVSASLTLAAMSAGLGLLLADVYPSFVRWFCLPYAALAVGASVLGWAMHSATRRPERE